LHQGEPHRRRIVIARDWLRRLGPVGLSEVGWRCQTKSGSKPTVGNPLWKDSIATSNAVVVDRLLQAGAIVVGMTNIPFMLPTSRSC
jgi:Amidase